MMDSDKPTGPGPHPVDIEVLGGVTVPVYKDLPSALMAAGIQPGEAVESVVVRQYGNSLCVRCFLKTDEDRCGVCFACGMLEDNDSEDWEIQWGLKSLKRRGYTLQQWLDGRRKYGSLYPSPIHLLRIETLEANP